MQAEIINLRGFDTEIHFAKTRDGYYINVVRIINPKNTEADGILKRPVVFNHGLLESATIWLASSRDVRPESPSRQCFRLGPENNFNSSTKDFADPRYVNAAFMLANHGYDVWLMSMRGTDWSLRHNKLSPKDPAFWDYSLDDFALTDVPTVIDYVQKRTGALKVGYVGHSQATFSIFGLLSIRPRYAEIVEPVVAVAPVSYFDHITSIARAVFAAVQKLTSDDKNGPFPADARSSRKLASRACRSKSVGVLCELIEILASGHGDHLPSGIYSHFPFFTSLKVMRHFAQLINLKRNAMYDYGSAENLRLYGSRQSPSYPTEMIRSRALCLISTKSDALSPPKDVSRFKRRLSVPLYRDIFIDEDFNHLDLLVHPRAADLVNKPILDIFESFESKLGTCHLQLDNHLKRDMIHEQVDDRVVPFMGDSETGSNHSGQGLKSESERIQREDHILDEKLNREAAELSKEVMKMDLVSNPIVDGVEKLLRN